MNKKFIGFSIIFSLLCSLMIIINIVFADETTIYVNADSLLREEYPNTNYGDATVFHGAGVL